MSLNRCQLGGKPGFRGAVGCKCHTYTAGDPISRERAKKKAMADWRRKNAAAKRNRKPNRKPRS